MRDKIQTYVDAMNAKYMRVKLDDVVSLDTDPFDFFKSTTEILKTRRSGSFLVACVHYPDPGDFIDPDLDDSLLDAECDKADKILAEVSGLKGWIIPEGDPLYCNEDFGLILTGG